MGVPAFFRWLQDTYPSIVTPCIEEPMGVNALEPNPNGIEFDNLYLDMNGIIHPCTHPENKPAPKDEDEMMVAIFEYIDRLFDLVRPRKLLYMAVDGVAPRAKMNQQRARRFLSKKEVAIKKADIAKIRSDLLARGCKLPPEKTESNNFDSNCITPGTPFMQRLSACLHYYVHSRMNTNPAWKKVKVILSDASVPGEGEHKIMEYIRRQRGQPDYDPNIWHCLCGADADLIMLGLATHEAKFTILREFFDKTRTCEVCNLKGHSMQRCRGLPKYIDYEMQKSIGTTFIFIHLHVLRQYLADEFTLQLPFTYDIERIIDDWVFLCFFVGNDFLPRLPSMDIYCGSITEIMYQYKEALPKMKGYVTNNGRMNILRVLRVVRSLCDYEAHFFVESNVFDCAQQIKRQHIGAGSSNQNGVLLNNKCSLINFVREGTTEDQRKQEDSEKKTGNEPDIKVNSSTFKIFEQEEHNRKLLESTKAENEQRGVKRKLVEEPVSNGDSDANEGDFKNQYYEHKFGVDGYDKEFRLKVAKEYVRGLQWVLGYYYQGVPSWKWYYPYHYSPLCTDVADVEKNFRIEFDKGKPFQPLEQLMGVFPASSSSHVPPVWAPLMSDPFSPILDLYPIDFKTDLNGKVFLWQGVTLLPFVSEERLKKALAPLYNKLSKNEKIRNKYGDEVLYIYPGNMGYKYVTGLYKKLSFRQGASLRAGDMFGQVLLAKNVVDFNEGTLNSPVRNLKPISYNKVVCVRFRNPLYPDTHVFSAKKLHGAESPRAQGLARGRSRGRGDRGGRGRGGGGGRGSFGNGRDGGDRFGNCRDGGHRFEYGRDGGDRFGNRGGSSRGRFFNSRGGSGRFGNCGFGNGGRGGNFRGFQRPGLGYV